jgi:hypothetical protein
MSIYIYLKIHVWIYVFLYIIVICNQEELLMTGGRAVPDV